MHWTDVEEIAQNLEDYHTDYYDYALNLPLDELKELIFSLDDFEDQEVEMDEDMLKARLGEILEKWSHIRVETDEEE